MPPSFENSGAEQVRPPEAAPQRGEGPGDFARRAVSGVRDWMTQSNLSVDSFQNMRGRAGGNLNRFVGWLQGFGGGILGVGMGRGYGNRMGNGPERGGRRMDVAVQRNQMPLEEATMRMQLLQEKVPGLRFVNFPEGDPQALERYLTRRSINPSDYGAYIEKVEKTADRLMNEVGQRPGWQDPESWMQGVAFDGMRFWAFNQASGETCVATAGQLLFSRGNPDQIRNAMRTGKSSTMMQSINGKAVKFDITAKGQRFTTDNGQRKIYARDGDGDTVEIYAGGRVQSVTHFGSAVVTRVNGRGAGVAKSAHVEDSRVHSGLPEGTFVRMPNGEWMGKSSTEIQKRGLDGYMRALARLPVRELGAYVSGVMNDQHEDPYKIRSSQAIGFYRDDLSFDQSLKRGLGDCREIAKLGEKVLRMKGIKAVTIQLDPDHAGAVWIEPSGNPQAPFIARSIESSGFHDDFKPGRTPGEALANTWDTEKGRHPGAAMIMNDAMKAGRTSYDRVAASILNARVAT